MMQALRNGLGQFIHINRDQSLHFDKSEAQSSTEKLQKLDDGT